MRKIPTVFIRDPENMAHVLPEVHPDCQWVLAGEGAATRKFDGTCCMFDGSLWWARREVKPGKILPDNFKSVEHDPSTGKTVGWVPMAESSFAQFHGEAVEALIGPGERPFEPGTYELCGPKINGNPEGFDGHVLVEHASAEVLDTPDLQGATPEFALDILKGYLLDFTHEGIVWHRENGDMAKLKRRDFQ